MIDLPLQSKTYVLRIWEKQGQQAEADTRWRYTITDPQTQQQHGFNTLRDMCQFLELKLAQPPVDS